MSEVDKKYKFPMVTPIESHPRASSDRFISPTENPKRVPSAVTPQFIALSLQVPIWPGFGT